VQSSTVQTGRTVPTNSGLSGKERLLNVLKASANQGGWVRRTPKDLAKEVGISEHEVVHFIKEGLARENLISYRSNRTKGIGRLRLTPIAMGKNYSRNTRSTPWFLEKFGSKENPITIAPTEVSEKLQNFSQQKFPLIEAIAQRGNSLDAAAKLADQAGASDLALLLMERAESPLNSLEKEAVNLLIAYNECSK
jgi:hypothetical protein